MSELGRCTIAEATFPCLKAPVLSIVLHYRPDPRTSAVIDKCVNEMLEWSIIQERPSPRGRPCTIVAKSAG